jgi:hypothetical protein
MEEIKLHLAPDSGIDKTFKRNASLAKVHHCFCKTNDSPAILQLNGNIQLKPVRVVVGGKVLIRTGLTPRVLELTDYLFENLCATSTFGDLKPYLEKLDIAEQKSVLEVAHELLRGVQSREEGHPASVDDRNDKERAMVRRGRFPVALLP